LPLNTSIQIAGDAYLSKNLLSRFPLLDRERYSNGMRCPYCRYDNDRVVDSRSIQDGFVIRRRRECVHCKRRYSTYERLEEVAVKIVKKNGIRDPFEREKIRRGLTKACWKRPVSDEQIESVVTAVEMEVYGAYESEVDSHRIGELVMQQLAKLDQVAFVRFASVYREFKDVRDFVDELQPMLRDELREKG